MAARKKENGKSASGALETWLPPEEFVLAWQECESLAEAREKLGERASARAKRMRDAGVELKLLSTPRTRIDVDALNKAIKASR